MAQPAVGKSTPERLGEYHIVFMAAPVSPLNTVRNSSPSVTRPLLFTYDLLLSTAFIVSSPARVT